MVNDPDSAFSFVVRFGRSSYVASFSASQSIPRDSTVVIRTVRGDEIGTVLSVSPKGMATIGAILRPASSDDHERNRTSQQLADRVLRATNESNAKPVVFVDAEATLDGSLVLLHVLPQDECDLTPELNEWSQRFETRVSLVDLTVKHSTPDAPDAQDGHCGKPNCGEGNCSTTGGCSTGSCSRGAVKNAGELTDYFKTLRQQMEADTAKRVTLN